MDGKRFDALSRSVAAAGTRRGILHFLGTLPLLSVLLTLVADEEAEAKRRRKPQRRRADEQKARHTNQNKRVQDEKKRHKNKHKRKKKRKHHCKPQSDAQTCTGRCGQIPNNCGRMVDCGSCACAAACPVCQTCNSANGRCETNSPFIGQECGLPGQVCQTDGVCVCDDTTCADGQRCNGIVCVCDAASCPTGCCDGTRTCSVNEDAACGTGGGRCTRCTGTGVTCGGGGTPGQCGCTSQGCGNQTCGSKVDNCGQTISCTGCTGCCDGDTCRNGNSREACGQGGEVCHPCSGVCVGGVCSSCDPTNAPCPDGLCCVDGACVASCPACQTCIDGACASDSGQDRTTCQLPDDGGTGVCCNGACCAGCCDASAEHGECSACLAFVTSISYTGNLGGLSGADAKCQARAEAGGFWGSYKAWLSSTVDSPSSRFRCAAESCSTEGYTPVGGGLPISFSWQTLTQQDLVRPLNITELGSDSITPVWTNTQQNGTPIGGVFASCVNWTDGTAGTIDGRVGDSNSRFAAWTDSHSNNCADPCSLYCFQQT